MYELRWVFGLLCLVNGAGACGAGCLTCSSTACTSCSEGWMKDYYGLDWDCVPCINDCRKCSMIYAKWVVNLVVYWQIPGPCERCKTGYYQNPAGNFACVPCGTQCSSCGLENGVCNFCNSGYYRDQNPPYQNCFPCSSCNSRQKQVWHCVTANDAVCENCASNQRVTFSECISCVDRVTYASADQTRCDPCTDCTTSQYLPSGNECIGSRNAICLNCADNRASKTVNSLTCNSCVAGYYLSGTSGACVNCNTPSCPANTYIQCTNGERVCVVCRGHTQANACPTGTEPSRTCAGTDRADSTCTACGLGAERPPASVSTMLKCFACGLGYYKSTQDTTVCVVCTNKAPTNSLYLSWGNTPPSSNTCPW